MAAELTDELARVLWDSDQARALVRRAGFPPAMTPSFRTAQIFWAQVIEGATNGVMLGGVAALVDEAAKQFPYNPIFKRYQAQSTRGASASAPPQPPAPSTPHAPGPYDVFLSHSSADKPAVEAIAARLRDEARLHPFFDKWALVPGEPWIPALERALEHSTTVAVFFGPHGRGAWHDQETQLALVLAAEERGKRVIPVLLPGARRTDVGGFMRLRTWVELAQGDGFERLVAGITGRAPGSGPRSGNGVEPRPTEPAPPAAKQEQPTSPAPSPSAKPTVVEPGVILLCTANAAHPDQRLWLEEELRAIDDALQRSRQRNRYAPRMCLAVTFAKVLNEIDDHEPAFVHFSGHGDPSGNLVLKGERSEELLVPPARIAELLEELPKRPTLVTFSTCHSRALAEAAARHAEFAIGFDGELDDDSAPLFSATLYERLASREAVDVPRAFRLAVLACRAEGLETVELARLFAYPGRAVLSGA